jgi:hypothetical protein
MGHFRHKPFHPHDFEDDFFTKFDQFITDFQALIDTHQHQHGQGHHHHGNGLGLGHHKMLDCASPPPVDQPPPVDHQPPPVVEQPPPVVEQPPPVDQPPPVAEQPPVTEQPPPVAEQPPCHCECPPPVVPPVEPPCAPTNILTQGSFEGTSIPAGQTWDIIPVDGWKNLGSPTNGIEVWSAQVVANQTDGHLQATGNFAVETDSTGSLNFFPGGVSVKDALVTEVDANTGQTYELSFDFSSRNIPTWVTATDTDSFDVFWNGAQVGHFDPADSMQWSKASMQVVGAAGVDKIEIREAGADDSLGSVIDNVQLVGCVPHTDFDHII